MIVSHLTYCLTSVAQANKTTLKPLETLYKQSLKVLDRKPNTQHHCLILQKYKLLSWENLIMYKNLCLLYKILHNTAPPPLHPYITQRSSTNRTTRASTRGDCIVPHRTSTFSRSSFSVRVSQDWNSIPTEIRDLNTYRTFTAHLKSWHINSNQTCTH